MGNLVSGNQCERSLEFLIVDELLGGVNADSACTLRCIVEVGKGEWVVGPIVSVELGNISIVSLGESPNNAVGGLHI